MKRRLQRSSICLAIAITMVAPHMAVAQTRFPIDIGFDPLPADGSTQSDTGLGNTSPTIPKTTAPAPGGGNPNAVQPQNPPMPPMPGASPGFTPRPTASPTVSGTPGIPGASNSPNNSANGKTMTAVALTNPELSCSLFTSSAHKDLVKAIEDLTKAVGTTSACADSPSAKSIKSSGDQIKQSIESLMAVMQASDASQVNPNTIDQTVSSALTAVGNLGDVLNNSTFLNSACGRQTMTTGKVLLAFNDVVNGLAPYALFAVSMNAALAPALPFVIGGTILTSSISALSKLMDKGAWNLDDATTRNAILQNTCQFTKVAKKVRFMQLAQSGKIDKITQELEQDVDLYKAKFSKLSTDLTKLLDFKTKWDKYFSAIDKQLESDRSDLSVIAAQVKNNGDDDILMCTLAQELANFAQDGRMFPASVFNNLSTSISQNDNSQKLQAATMRSLHISAMKRVAYYAPKASEDQSALKACAQAARSWISGIQQATDMTAKLQNQNKVALNNQLNQYSEYRSWKNQFDFIETQKITISRVEKAMEELAKDTSIIDRSELAQRMVSLKAGLFGTRGWSWGNKAAVPVVQWIDHTKSVYDRTVSAFITDFNTVQEASYSITKSGLGKTVIFTPSGMAFKDPMQDKKDRATAAQLANLDLTNVQLNSRSHEIICQHLETAWLDWSAAMDHLGAIQFFCDMIDPVLDAKMDQYVVEQCRGITQLNGSVTKKSLVNSAKELLVSKGFKSNASVISARMKELQCPMPAVSVMNK